MPREPLVLGQPRRPSSSSSAFTSSATRTHVRPSHARPRIEIDAQLVGMLEVAGAHRVRVQLDAAEVDDPGQPRRVVTTISSAVRPEGNDSVPCEPSGPLVGRALLVERLALGPVDEPLQHDRPVAIPASAPRSDREVVADDVELRELAHLW
jgi:hypothetical protein